MWIDIAVVVALGAKEDADMNHGTFVPTFDQRFEPVDLVALGLQLCLGERARLKLAHDGVVDVAEGHFIIRSMEVIAAIQ